MATLAGYGSWGSTGAGATRAKKTASGSGVNWTSAGIAMQLAGNLTGAFGSYSAARQTAASYKAQAKDVLSNAQLQVSFEQMNQKLSAEAYGLDRLELMREQRERMSSLHVGYAAEGLEMTGTPLAVMAEQARADAENLDLLDRNAQIAAFQSQLNCISVMTSAEYEAKALKRQAKYAKRAANINLFSGLLSSVGNAAFSYGMAR